MPVICHNVMKIRVERTDPDRMRLSVFLGVDEGHLQKSGELVVDVGVYQNILCALRMGLELMVQKAPEATYVPLHVIVEGEMEALGRADELNGRMDVTRFPEP